MNEVYKEVPGFEGLYSVSNFGNVYAHKRKIHLSKNRITVDGYRYVALSKDGKPHEYRVHKLVAMCFIDNPLNLDTINHIDGNKLNNRVDNLEWATRSEQMFHAYKLGLKKPMRGTLSPHSKLTDEQVSEIISTHRRYKKGYGACALAKKYNVHNSTILRIVNGKTKYGTV